MKKLLFCFAISVLGGCTIANVNVKMLSERTALENQVLGSYNALDTQMLLAASVRGVDSSGKISRPPKHSREYKDTLSAMQTLDFHEDDLETFKHLGWVGENNQGLIDTFKMDRSGIPEQYKNFAERYPHDEFEFVVSKINDSREKIMRRVIDMNENLTESDFPEVKAIFAKIYAQNARPGDKIQDSDGNWRTKKEAP